MANKQLEDLVSNIFPNEKKTKIKKTVNSFGNCIIDLVKTFLVDQEGFTEEKTKEQKNISCTLCKKSVKGSACIATGHDKGVQICLSCAWQIAEQMNKIDQGFHDLKDKSVKRFLPIGFASTILLALIDKDLMDPTVPCILIEGLKEGIPESALGLTGLKAANKKIERMLGRKVYAALRDSASKIKTHEIRSNTCIDMEDFTDFIELAISKNLASEEAFDLIISHISQQIPEFKELTS